MRLHQALRKIDEATVSRNVSKNSDAVSAPAQHSDNRSTFSRIGIAHKEPVLLPMAVGRMAFSTRLLSISTRPSSR
jgi:hypothetical protein